MRSVSLPAFRFLGFGSSFDPGCSADFGGPAFCSLKLLGFHLSAFHYFFVRFGFARKALGFDLCGLRLCYTNLGLFRVTVFRRFPCFLASCVPRLLGPGASRLPDRGGGGRMRPAIEKDPRRWLAARQFLCLPQ